MRVWKIILFLSMASCSTLSQNMESPVVIEKQKYALGGGAVYGHNISNNDVDEEETTETDFNLFLGARYAPLQNIEMSLTGGTLGLDWSSGIDFRIRYQWWGGWVDPFEDLDDDVGPEVDDDYMDQEAHVPDGWVNTASLGLFIADKNRLDDAVTKEMQSGFYFSNSTGYKSGSWVFYFGGKLIQLDHTYSHKIDRFNLTDDINSSYAELTYGVFGGVTLTSVSSNKHTYILDLLFSLTQLPKAADEEGQSFYPGITLSGWYVD